MDGIRGEVSNKIRSAIKAKLMELGAYVDDELPDYIMVMVANKRSRQQMEEDLQLFLGDSTSTFTSWLHTVLSKLQQVTVNSSELKKGSEKKRMSPEDPKKEKRKKLKKEKDREKPDNTPGKEKLKDKAQEEKVVGLNELQFQTTSLKSKPVDTILVKDSMLTDSQIPQKIQSNVGNAGRDLEKKSLLPKSNEYDDDDDFINLKADVEADMWGEAEDPSSSAAKSVGKPHTNTTETRSLEPRIQTNQHLKQTALTSEKISNKKLSDGVSASASSSPSKTTATVPKPVPRIIRISETIREEQETLKPTSKVVRDPQKEEERSPPSPIIFSARNCESTENIEDDLQGFGRHIARELSQLSPKQRKLAELRIQQALAKRVFQSHIVSQRSLQDKADKSVRHSSSSHATDSRIRRGDQRSSRKREQPDLRETLRKERQKEREHGRDRDRDQRRAGERNQGRKSQSAVSSVVRPPLSHKDENGPDPTVASVVRVKPRPQLPAALQANRSLILKAVAEAQKSVSKTVIRPELTTSPTKHQPIKKSIKDRLQIRKQSNVKSVSPSKSARLPSRETLKKMSFTVVAKTEPPSKESPVEEFDDVSDEGSIILDPSLNILIQVPASPAMEESHESQDPIQTEKVRRWIKDVEAATKSEIRSDIHTEGTADLGTETDAFAGMETASNHASDEDPEEIDDNLEVDTTSLKTSDIHSNAISEDQPQRKPSGTQFVVTLDGFDPKLLRSFALECEGQVDNSVQQHSQSLQDDQNLEDQESILRDELLKEQLLRQELLRQQAAVREQKGVRCPTVAASSAPVNPSLKRPASPISSLEARPTKVMSTVSKGSSAERCKFWPACKNGEKCEFQHPSVPCKLFPNCKFADRCLYIHPTCHYNTACTRVDCPYTHTGPRPTLSTPPVVNHSSGQTIKQACKYFPNCSNISCPFIHPMVCKFGTHCSKPKCQFIHSDKGLITKHKWVRH